MKKTSRGGLEGGGVVGAMPPEEQEAGWELVISENAYNLMRKIKNYTKGWILYKNEITLQKRKRGSLFMKSSR